MFLFAIWYVGMLYLACSIALSDLFASESYRLHCTAVVLFLSFVVVFFLLLRCIVVFLVQAKLIQRENAKFLAIYFHFQSFL